MLAVVQLLALVLAYWAFRLITKKRLRDLKIRWSFVLFPLSLVPVVYVFVGFSHSAGLFPEMSSLDALNSVYVGAIGTIFISPILVTLAALSFIKERKARK